MPGEGTASVEAGASSQQPLAAALTPAGGAQHSWPVARPGALRSGAQPHGAGSAATRAKPASTAANSGEYASIDSWNTPAPVVKAGRAVPRAARPGVGSGSLSPGASRARGRPRGKP